MPKYSNLESVLLMAKALGDENRLRALMALQISELCVCQITELLGLAPSTVSQHMSVLRQAGLVESSKQGRWIYYRLACYEQAEPQTEMLEWIGQTLAKEQRMTTDQKRIRQIMKINPEELCRKQIK